MDGLEKVSIFAKLSKQHLENLRKLAKREKFAKDTSIFFQDDRSDSLYVMISGAVKVFQTADDGKERVLNTLGPGEIFGELGLLDASGRSASVTTLESTEVLTITNEDLRALVKSSPEVLWRIVEALCERVRQLSTETLDLSFRDVPYRILRVIITATSKHGQITDAGTLVSIDAKTLAGSVNCGVDQAMRVLKRLEERGLLRVDEGNVIVPDVPALGRALEYEESWPMLDTLSSAGARAGRNVRRLTGALAGPVPLFVMILLGSGAALAHERFVKHNLLRPLHYEFFGRWPGKPFGMHPDLTMIGVRVMGILAAFFAIWFARRSLTEFVERTFLRRVGGLVQTAGHKLACFLTDRPVRGKVFHSLGEWAVILFLRSPGLVLMYSATNNSLVMPSYPLDPPSAAIFQFAQVGLAILILTQTWLPFCGALILGTWLYLFRWGWMVAVDAIPVLTVAVVYCTSPWQSHKLPITKINESQMRWVRLVLGFGFVALGWLKVYNHNLVAGVADNAPSVLNDPMVAMLTGGGGVEYHYRREAWVVAFGLAEVMSGFLVMIGVFTRVWATIMAFMFTKLMLVDFGWDEIPHIYPIAAMLVVIFSNRLTSEVDPIERMDEDAWRAGKPIKRVAIIGVTAVVSSIAIIFPLLYIISFFDRSGM